MAAELAPFNCTFMPSPAVTVGATSAREVAAAVRWAGDHGHPVAVVATGHGLHSDLSGAVAISTRRMRDVTIDPHARTARVGAGARWAQVIEAAAPHGLAPLNGSSSSVGVVGYTLGGGVGPMGRRFGFAADHVRRVQLVANLVLTTAGATALTRTDGPSSTASSVVRYSSIAFDAP